MMRRNGRAALDSRGCLPPVAAQAGGGGEATCSADREQAPPCPVCDAGRWSCHRRVASEGRVACLAGLARGACQPRLRGACGMSCEAREGRLLTSLRRRGASYTHTHAAFVAGARYVPVGRTVLVESVCRQGGTHSGTVPTGRGSKGDSRGGPDWHPWRGARLRKVGHGSTRNFLANTRAPPSLRRARCGRTSTSVIVPRRAA